MHSSLSNKLNIQFSLKSKICQLSQLSEQESPEGTCISLRIKTLYKVQVHAFTFWMGGGQDKKSSTFTNYALKATKMWE